MFSRFVYRNMNPLLSKYFKFVIKRRSEDLSWQRKLLLENLKISTIIDVGAHYGEFYEEVRRHEFRRKVISIEPTRSSYEILKKYEGCDRNFKALNVALADVAGELTFYEYEESSMNSALEVDSSSNYKLNLKESVSSTQCITLDQVIETESLQGDNIFVKLDVQGYEVKILQGLRNCLQSVNLIQVEISINPIYRDASNLLELVDWLKLNGFAIVSVVTERFHESAALAYDIDILCVRRR